MGAFIPVIAKAVVAVVGVVAASKTGKAQAGQQVAQGDADQAALDRQAELEGVSALDREVGRKRRLNIALATSIANIGARGVKFEGSAVTPVLSDIDEASREEAGEKLSDLTKIAQLRHRGASAAAAGRARSRSTLLQTRVNTIAGVGQVVGAAGEAFELFNEKQKAKKKPSGTTGGL